MGDQTRSEVSAGDLVKRARDGDSEAWELLLDRFGGLVEGVVRSYGLGGHDAQDAWQTVWFMLTEHISRIQHPERVGAWLATTTHHTCRRQLRLTRRTAPADPARLDAVDHRSPETLHLAAERRRQVRRAIAALAEPDRTVVTLDLHEPGAPAATVAEFTGLPAEEVPRVRRRARRRLSRLLTDENQQKGPRDDPRG